MGEMVEFPSNGSQARGYLALPDSASGPGVLVVQEWWGLVPQLKGVADRLAGEGFVALAPDLFHGEMAGHQEMDKANRLMSELPPDRAARDMGGAITYLIDHDATRGDAVGVVGFCMGGMLTLMIAAREGDRVGAAAPFYGAPLGENGPDWTNLTATVRGHFAENDDFFSPGPVKELEEKLKGMGKDVDFEIHPGTGHGFGNEEDPLGNYDQAEYEKAWAQTVELFRSEL